MYKTILFCSERSGSSRLHRFLYELADGEFPAHPFRNMNFEDRDEVYPVLYNFYDEDNWGFKHGFVYNPKFVSEEVIKYHGSIVFIKRRNILRQQVSNILGGRTHYFNVDSIEERNEYRSKDMYGSIDPDKLKEMVEGQYEAIQRWKGFLDEHEKEYYDINYEDLFVDKTDEEKKEILFSIGEYVNRDIEVIDKTIERFFWKFDERLKLNNSKTYSKIENVDQIEEQVGSEKTGYLLK